MFGDSVVALDRLAVFWMPSPLNAATLSRPVPLVARPFVASSAADPVEGVGAALLRAEPDCLRSLDPFWERLSQTIAWCQAHLDEVAPEVTVAGR